MSLLCCASPSAVAQKACGGPTSSGARSSLAAKVAGNTVIAQGWNFPLRDWSDLGKTPAALRSSSRRGVQLCECTESCKCGVDFAGGDYGTNDSKAVSRQWDCEPWASKDANDCTCPESRPFFSVRVAIAG